MNSSDDKIVSLDIQEINLDAPSSKHKAEVFSIDTVTNDLPDKSNLGDGIELLKRKG